MLGFGLLSAVLLCKPALAHINNLADEPIQPLEPMTDINPGKALLGKQLFNDTRLSSTNSVSCASCHDLAKGGHDGMKVSIGVNGKTGNRNSPTVFNAAYNFRQLWDGKAKNLAAQANMALVNQDEMDLTWADIDKKLSSDEAYKKQFNTLYDGVIDKHSVTNAIAEYEKTLIAVNSPFDQYLKGNDQAVSDVQKQGYELFKSYGCSSCHQGKNVGGNMFQKFGVLKDISLRDGGSDDLGRYNITGNEWDKYVFKVPSLRMVTQTAPYFHDGSVKTLQEAVDIMIEFQLGRTVPDEDRNAIIDFLGTLVGENKEMNQ